MFGEKSTSNLSVGVWWAGRRDVVVLCCVKGRGSGLQLDMDMDLDSGL